MKKSKAYIVATIGPASENYETLSAMVQKGLDVVRLNFSWGDMNIRKKQMDIIRRIEKELGRKIITIADLPGPRVQESKGHHYNSEAIHAVTEEDKKSIGFAIEENIDYIAVSFVGSVNDVHECRETINGFSGAQKIIAKIERQQALDSLDQIIEATDVVMVARGDLGNEVPLEQIPFVQNSIIHKANANNKPVIVATEMLLSMVQNPKPTRAEVTDVAEAILQGADAVMLSEETAIGKYPVETVVMMEKIVSEAEHHMNTNNIKIL